ncbi:MAG: hypothetical protein JJD97_14885 [Gemmatimonadaceae bacterium]|nr:hypothetical protein [Gemmatimonadaceae bacterium]
MVARKAPVLAADGAVLFLERVSPALEQVDSSSGAIGTAVNRAIAQLAPIIEAAPADVATREQWLERLWTAHEADAIPYIETLADHWGALCSSKPLASAWADRLLDVTRLALSPDPSVRGYFHGTSACLSALYAAERHQELVDLLQGDVLWAYKQWSVRALVTLGRKADAIRYAEAARGPWTDDGAVDAVCEEILLSSGLADEAYTRYGVRANHGGTYLATFRRVAAKYPNRKPGDILANLAATTPGNEGKWFAAAKDAGLYDEALALAGQSPCDPRTLTRAARDFVDAEPRFSFEVGLLALRWLVEGYGYEITGADVRAAYGSTIAAAERLGSLDDARHRIRELLLSAEPGARVVRDLLGREQELS